MRKRLLVVLAVGLVASAVQGATVVGDLHDGVLGNTLNATLIFHPELTPMGIGTATYLDVTRKTNVVGGPWSMNLVGGLYTVQCIPFGRQIAIFVPVNSTNTYQFNQVADIVLFTPTGTNTYSIVNVSNLFVTNLVAQFITNVQYLVASNIITTNITFITATGDTLNVNNLNFTNGIGINLSVSNLTANYFTLTNQFLLSEYPWPGPTNTVYFTNAPLQFYASDTDIEVTNVGGLPPAGLGSSTLLCISNSGATNIVFYIPTNILKTATANPIVITNNDIYEYWFMYSNGRLTGIGQYFHQTL